MGKIGKQDYAKAVKFYQKACDLKSVGACQRLGFLYQYESRVQQDLLKAAMFYGKTCDMGLSDGCYNLANLYEMGDLSIRTNGDTKRLEQDYSKAVKFYKKACNGKYSFFEKPYKLTSVACFRLGNLYETGRIDIKRDILKAISFYEKSCDEGYTSG